MNLSAQLSYNGKSVLQTGFALLPCSQSQWDLLDSVPINPYNLPPTTILTYFFSLHHMIVYQYVILFVRLCTCAVTFPCHVEIHGIIR